MEGNVVIPGDFLATSEEYSPGDGTFDRDGNIYSSVVGEVKIDRLRRLISVIPRTKTPPVPRIGSILYGRIVDIKESMVIVEPVLMEGGGDRSVATANMWVIHISNVKNGFVSDLGREFGYMDIIRAKVVDPRMLRLSTVPRDCGVVKAFCPVCKVGLRRKNNALECPRCKRIEIRKLSSEYGKGVMV